DLVEEPFGRSGQNQARDAIDQENPEPEGEPALSRGDELGRVLQDDPERQGLLFGRAVAFGFDRLSPALGAGQPRGGAPLEGPQPRHENPKYKPNGPEDSNEKGAGGSFLIDKNICLYICYLSRNHALGQAFRARMRRRWDARRCPARPIPLEDPDAL